VGATKNIKFVAVVPNIFIALLAFPDLALALLVSHKVFASAA